MDRRHRGRVGLATWVTPVLVGIGGACAPDTPSAIASRIAGYATMHDTMPEAIHEAKHRAVERAEAEVARSNSAEAMDARLQRIPGSKDAWLDFTLRRRADGPLAAMTDTVTLLMNCNADSLVVLDADGERLLAKYYDKKGKSEQTKMEQFLHKKTKAVIFIHLYFYHTNTHRPLRTK